MANITTAELSRAENLRRNLRRIFSNWGNQTQIAKDAGLHRVHLAQIIAGDASNPTISTIEAISIALEISVETLISSTPSDADLRISSKTLNPG